MHKAKPLVRVDLDAVVHNYLGLRERSGCEAWAVVKADAYGHGMAETVAALARAGAKTMAVGGLDEAADLRALGFGGGLVSLLGPVDQAEAEAMVEMDVTPFVGRVEQLVWLSGAGRRLGRAAAAVLKFDTGMSRLGFAPGDVAGVLSALEAAPWLRPVAAASHLSSADMEEAGDFTAAQAASLGRVAGALRAAGRQVRTCLCNSAGILAGVGRGFDIVRPGVAMYGTNPFLGTAQESLGSFLRPTMAVTARVLAVRDVAAGAAVSYGRTFTAERDMRLAVVAAGYADGYSRGLSGRGFMCLRGRRVPIVGRVCMQMTVVDATAAPDAQPGEDICLLGGDGPGAITAEDLAGWWGTITYEVFCVLGRLNPRVYV